MMRVAPLIEQSKLSGGKTDATAAASL